MTKILFVHNTTMWYRRPFFKRLSEIYDVKFVFTHIQVCKDIYGADISEQIEGLESVNYKALKNYFGIAFGLIRELSKEDYDVIIGGYLNILSALPDKVFIMPNVSNISVKEGDYINKEKLKKKLKIADKKVVLYVGRLIKRKGVDYLIKAFAKLKNEINDVVLIIIGRGECRDELELLVKNLNIEDSVYFMGYVEDELLPAYYLLCNICVVPSITYGMADPWVLVVNEAMYFGKPVIATDAVGAAFDMIKDGENGFMVPEKDSEALYEAMKKILSDPELEEKMGKESKKIIERKFRYEHMIEGFSKAINSL